MSQTWTNDQKQAVKTAQKWLKFKNPPQYTMIVLQGLRLVFESYNKARKQRLAAAEKGRRTPRNTGILTAEKREELRLWASTVTPSERRERETELGLSRGYLTILVSRAKK